MFMNQAGKWLCLKCFYSICHILGELVVLCMVSESLEDVCKDLAQADKEEKNSFGSFCKSSQLGFDLEQGSQLLCTTLVTVPGSSLFCIRGSYYTFHWRTEERINLIN